MINTKKFFVELKKNNIDFFSGVPDSVLKNFSNYLDKFKKKNIIAVNEGNAVGVGIGYFLSTKKIPCIYFQNSGLGNSINPLISIAHRKVYSIPMLLVIGWRGSPKVNNDEPQHNLKGKITQSILKLLNIKTIIIRKNNDLSKIRKLILFSKKTNQPVACLVEKNTFSNINFKRIFKNNSQINRSDFIDLLLNSINYKTKIISTTGYTSRELYQIRKIKKYKKGKDFYMVGGMGHAAIVSSSFSKFSNSNSICLDGDGSFLMHLGSIFTSSHIASKKFKYILLNNGSHESVGGQKTFSENLNTKQISKAFKFKNYFIIKSKKDMNRKLKLFLKSHGPSFLEVIIKNQSLKNLTRPKNLIDIKKEFIK